ncbi:OsmC family protein [Paenibacillus sp. TY11]|uniref:OsmC family protein n=1 Tax=Paenibacillus sp. TY11 TaxID=3448633 RepID=UPI00403A5223
MADVKIEINNVWFQNTKGHGKMKADYLKTNIAIPEALGGSGEGAHPKELLVSSATTCYIMTLVYLLEMKQVPVTGLMMNTEAVISKKEGMIIVHLPQLILSTASTNEQVQSAREVIMSAEQACEVGVLLRKAGVQIEVEGKVSIETEEDFVSQYVDENGLDWN